MNAIAALAVAFLCILYNFFYAIKKMHGDSEI